MALAATQGIVERLRERIARISAQPRAYLAHLRTGMPEWDGLFPAGGAPLGVALALCGPAGAGKLSLALRHLAAAQKGGRLCAYVDNPGEFYPPAACALGVDLPRLLVVRPKAFEKGIWAATQLLRSGAFGCVALDLGARPAPLSLAQSKNIADAARAGGCLSLVLTQTPMSLTCMLRASVEPEAPRGFAVEILRGGSSAYPRQAFLSWASVRAQAWADSFQEGALWPLGPVTSSALQKPKSPLPSGPRGIVGQRPGRDAPFPRVGPSLGL